MCGKLQCENVKTMPVFGIKPAIIQTPIRGTTCWGVDFQLGSDVPDPGMVNEGTKCGAGKVINKSKVTTSNLGFNVNKTLSCLVLWVHMATIFLGGGGVHIVNAELSRSIMSTHCLVLQCMSRKK